jgi:hypothetical protein
VSTLARHARFITCAMRPMSKVPAATREIILLISALSVSLTRPCARLQTFADKLWPPPICFYRSLARLLGFSLARQNIIKSFRHRSRIGDGRLAAQLCRQRAHLPRAGHDIHTQSWSRHRLPQKSPPSLC